MEESDNRQDELQKARNELALLYEISNAMHTTLKLDEILYIILTAVTAHVGLGFNRAMLFLVNEKESILEGKMGIGPDTGEEANLIWTYIEKEKINLEDLINNYKSSGELSNSKLNRIVKSLRVPLKEEKGGVLAMALLDGMPLIFRRGAINNQENDTLLNILKPEEFVTMPLKAKDKITGVLFADNPYTHKPITKDDIRILTMFANQAGLAIENSRLYEQTLTRSHSDSLTGLWNHGYFQYRLQEEINLAKETNKPLSIVMADLDNFKMYNDTLGHQEGDQILIHIAAILSSAVANQGYACRYGGEEFAILLPQINKTESYIIAENIRKQIEKYNFPYKNNTTANQLTISIGIAAFPQDGETKDSLLAYVDKALYNAKYKGKNCICI